MQPMLSLLNDSLQLDPETSHRMDPPEHNIMKLNHK